MFAQRFLVGAALTVPEQGRHPVHVADVLVLWVLATASIYLFNGVQDITCDRLNCSQRPLACGLVSTGFARRASLIGAAIALLGMAKIDPPLVALLAALLILGYAYSTPPVKLARRTSGTLLAVVLACLLSVLAGHLANTNSAAEALRFSPALIVFALASTGWAAFVGGLTKDLGDVPGDRAAGRRTLAVVYGPTTVRRITSVVAPLVGVTFLCGALAYAHPLVPAAAATLFGAVVLTLVNLAGDNGTERTRLRDSYRVFMVTQYAAHLLALASAFSAEATSVVIP